MAKEPATSDPQFTSDDIATDLVQALARDQFFLVYQPTIDLQSNAFAGVEALIRWRHPQRGDLSPDLFINELESSGEMLSVGRWTLRTACSQGALWHDRGYRFAVSVNVSPKQFESEQFVRDVADALNQSRFDPDLLVLEFSQATLLNDPATVSPRLEELKSLGVRLAVDDFEPGASQLDELEKFAIDIVKLNRAFVAQISSSPDASALVHALVQLGESRHLQIIASGVEDSEQRERLRNENVHVGQGYLFSKPHEAEEIDRYLEDFAIFSGKPL
jgi:EAL domain-containing protein (putative c-di-GMP-specific phosphodiesterase class I)